MDLCATPAVELARLIRARELSAAELLAAVSLFDAPSVVSALLVDPQPVSTMAPTATAANQAWVFCTAVSVSLSPKDRSTGRLVVGREHHCRGLPRCAISGRGTAGSRRFTL